MSLKPYKIRTYAQLDTWSRGTKQSQTKPIFPDLPLPSTHKTVLTSFFKRIYATTPQSQKQTQTKPIRPRATPTSAAALAPRLCRLNNNSDKRCLQNHLPHEKPTYNPDLHSACAQILYQPKESSSVASCFADQVLLTILPAPRRFLKLELSTKTGCEKGVVCKD